MSDQATELRQLVRAATKPAATLAPPPRLIVVCGGKGGVGTTTIAVNLAVALAQRGVSVVLADADFRGADAALLCGVHQRFSMAEVLAGRRSAEDVLQTAPAGVRLLPGVWANEVTAQCSPAAGQRVIDELRGLAAVARVVVLDVGSGLSRVIHHFWQAADEVLLVTTADSLAIMDSYAAVKVHRTSDSTAPLGVVVNRATERQAADVCGRLAQAGRRFLGTAIRAAGHVAVSPEVAEAARLGRPLMLEYPHSEPAHDIRRLSKRIQKEKND